MNNNNHHRKVWDENQTTQYRHHRWRPSAAAEVDSTAEFSLHPLNERCNSEQVSGDCWGMEFGFAEKRTLIDQIDYRSRIESHLWIH